MLDYGNVVDKVSSNVGTTSNRWWNMNAPLANSSSYSQKYNVNLAVNLFFLASKNTPIYPRMADSISIPAKANLWAVLGESPDLSLKFSVLSQEQYEKLHPQ
jgi:hypothetical protein